MNTRKRTHVHTCKQWETYLVAKEQLLTFPGEQHCMALNLHRIYRCTIPFGLLGDTDHKKK